MALNPDIYVWSSAGTNIKPSDSITQAGWLAGEQPPNEFMNFIQNYTTKAIDFFIKNGLGRWDNSFNYDIDAVIIFNGKSYVSLQNSNQNRNPETAFDWWKEFATVEYVNNKAKLNAGVGFDYYGDEATLLLEKGNTAIACKNQILIRADYPDLFANIGTIYDTFNGATPPQATEFRAPPQEVNGLGLYNRGVGATNGGVGTFQAEETAKNSLTFSGNLLPGHLHTYSGVNTRIQSTVTNPNFTDSSNVTGGSITQTSAVMDSVSAGTPSGTINGGNETRPRSLTVLKCVWTGK